MLDLINIAQVKEYSITACVEDILQTLKKKNPLDIEDLTLSLLEQERRRVAYSGYMSVSAEDMASYEEEYSDVVGRIRNYVLDSIRPLFSQMFDGEVNV